jgi:hypothetical protein
MDGLKFSAALPRRLATATLAARQGVREQVRVLVAKVHEQCGPRVTGRPVNHGTAELARSAPWASSASQPAASAAATTRARRRAYPASGSGTRSGRAERLLPGLCPGGGRQSSFRRFCGRSGGGGLGLIGRGLRAAG